MGSVASASSLSAYQQWLQQLQARQRSQAGSATGDEDLSSLFASLVAPPGAAQPADGSGSAGDGLSAIPATAALPDGGEGYPAADPARIGVQLQQQNPALFKALDSDGDGTLSASELSTGRHALRDAMRQAAAEVGSGDPGSAGAASGQFLAAVTTQLQRSDPALAAALSDSGTGSITAQDLQGAVQSLHLHHHHRHHGGGGVPSPLSTSGSRDGLSTPVDGSNDSLQQDFQLNLIASLLAG